MEWIGSVEIHVLSSAWVEHRHHHDDAYENVVLHVVWEDNKPVSWRDGSRLPTLELKNRVDNRLLQQYRRLAHSPEPIPCAAGFDRIATVTRRSMLDKILIERLESKASAVSKMLTRNRNDWEETCYQLVTKNFGFKVNTDPFHQLALSLPHKFILKHADKLQQVEALIFGQAGFLEESDGDQYYRQLQREYRLLGRKYYILARGLNKAQWRFLRLRPANFPTLRLAQLASLVFYRKNLFSGMITIDSVKGYREFFGTGQSEYWLHHYQFGSDWKERVSTMGSDGIQNIVINTVVTLLVAYGKSKNERVYIDRAVRILQTMAPEKNKITGLWKDLGMTPQNAFDSQAMVELYTHFCLKHRCLECNIGASLVKPRTS
jgi:hypothetical protein